MAVCAVGSVNSLIPGQDHRRGELFSGTATLKFVSANIDDSIDNAKIARQVGFGGYVGVVSLVDGLGIFCESVVAVCRVPKKRLIGVVEEAVFGIRPVGIGGKRIGGAENSGERIFVYLISIVERCIPDDDGIADTNIAC